MKRLTLQRELYSDTETQGVMVFGTTTLYTIEQEWRPTAPGGEPNNSCVPAGLYRLKDHQRPNGDGVVALLNSGLGVYYGPGDRPSSVGRYLILCHAGNWVKDVVGCIAPGLSRATSDQGPMVTSSKAAMKKLMEYIDGDAAEIEIIGDNGYLI